MYGTTANLTLLIISDGLGETITRLHLLEARLVRAGSLKAIPSRSVAGNCRPPRMVENSSKLESKNLAGRCRIFAMGIT